MSSSSFSLSPIPPLLPLLLLLILSLSLLSPLSPLNIRRNILHMTQSEIDAFVYGVVNLKYQPTNDPSLPLPFSIYDTFVSDHDTYQLEAHKGPAFFPWHRVFLSRFESLLQKFMMNESMTIPYWDFTNKEERMNVFASNIMGGNGTEPYQYVEDGPFNPSVWQHVIVNNRVVYEPLTRCFNCSVPFSPTMPWMNTTAPALPTPSSIAYAMSFSTYDTPPYDITSHNSFRNLFEGWKYEQCSNHNSVHVWIGGMMRRVPISPNDPMFWIHHSFVDKHYGMWQNMYYKGVEGGGYVPLEGERYGQNYGDLMQPFNVTVKYGVDMGNFNYEYEEEEVDVRLRKESEIFRGQREKEEKEKVMEKEKGEGKAN